MALIFPRNFDLLLKQIGAGIFLGVSVFVALYYYYMLPGYTRVGYEPEQPVPFSHALHVGNLGFHCTTCHNHVVESPHANVPVTQTCIACHGEKYGNIKHNSPLLSKVQESWVSGNPVQWKQIHKVPDYAYFNHSVHIARGVSCVSCHGQINEMPVVYHAKPLSMGWCLNCHRAPEDHIRPTEEVFNLTWKPEDELKKRTSLADKDGRALTQYELGQRLKEEKHINPPQTCQGCHR